MKFVAITRHQKGKGYPVLVNSNKIVQIYEIDGNTHVVFKQGRDIIDVNCVESIGEISAQLKN